MMKSESDMGFGYLVKVLDFYQETFFLLACSYCWLEESGYVIYYMHIILFVLTLFSTGFLVLILLSMQREGKG